MKRLALTFDDGLLNTYEVSYPILRALGVVATVFVVSGTLTAEVGSREVRPNDLSPIMGLKELRELAKAGWEIGSHSHTHAVFDLITDERAEHELAVSKTLLEEFKPVSFAFPAGHAHFRKEQIELAFKYYQFLRNVTWEPNVHGPLYDAYPVDDYPDLLTANRMDKDESVVTCHHRILKPFLFRDWLESLKAEGVEFVRLKDL